MKNLKPKLDINGLQISIIGLGKSGYSAAKLAFFFNAKVHVSDKENSKIIKIYKKELEELGAVVEAGEYSDKIYNSQLWILSPGVIMPKEIILKAKSKDILIISEIEFASWFAKFPIVGVTGSNGKTTTANLIYTICNNQNICPKLAGNIGIPFSKVVLKDLIKKPKKRLYVVEISSFQLERINHFRPKISIFLNISEDHLDRHKTMKNYIKAKMPVKDETSQPMGILHGGASVSLAESIGSTGSYIIIDKKKESAVGLEINANHVGSAHEGYVTGKGTLLHKGKTTHIWNIEIRNEQDKLVSLCRLTVMILKRPSL